MKKLVLLIGMGLGLSQMSLAQTSGVDQYILQARDEMARQRYLPAYDLLKRALSLQPEGREANLALGQTCWELRKYQESRAAYLKAYAFDKKDTHVVARLTQLNFYLRDWQGAIDMARLQELQVPGLSNSLLIGKAYYELEDYGQSVKYLSKAWQEDSSRAEIPFLAARSFVEMSNYKRAAGCYEQALALSPEKAEWMYEAGMAYSAVNNHPKAIEWMEKAAAKGYKQSNDFLHNLGIAYLGNKEFDKGIANFQELLRRKPEDIELLFTVGEAFYQHKKYDEAINTWDRILAIDKTHANAVYMIGLAYIKKGDNNKGKSLCEKAIQMDPALASLRQKKEGLF